MDLVTTLITLIQEKNGAAAFTQSGTKANVGLVGPLLLQKFFQIDHALPLEVNLTLSIPLNIWHLVTHLMQGAEEVLQLLPSIIWNHMDLCLMLAIPINNPLME